ncbi:MAG TPA: DUF6132 family protein [Clostridia bacterium]|nr:DUF6132 family protein [Clostridia bacterium]
MSVLKIIAGVIIGSVSGFAYYKLIGCPSGGCPITANPYSSTIYGAVLGFLISSLTIRK